MCSGYTVDMDMLLRALAGAATTTATRIVVVVLVVIAVAGVVFVVLDVHSALLALHDKTANRGEPPRGHRRQS